MTIRHVRKNIHAIRKTMEDANKHVPKMVTMLYVVVKTVLNYKKMEHARKVSLCTIVG